jgi:hypothetical protein
LGDIGDFFGGILGKFKDFGTCITHLGSCLTATANNMIEFGTYIVQHTFLKQLAGQAADCATDPDKAGTPECDQNKITTDGTPINPTSFGLLGVAGTTTDTLLAMPLPISGREYFASINPFKKASAATGQEDLEQSHIVLQIWTKTRNAALALSVVALVIVGFMIMFRFPLGPRNVVTIQNSLPRIAIALVLIVFSYAIAGLMIDLVRIAGSLLNSFLPSFSVGGAFLAAGETFAAFILAVAGIVLGFSLIAGPAAPGVAALGAIVALILFLIICIVMAIIFAVLIFKLVSRFIIFLFLVMFAPLVFLLAALPGGEGFIFSWFKRAAAALLAIPATGFVLSLAFRIGASGPTGFNIPASTFPSLMGAGSAIGTLFGWVFIAPIVGLVLFSMAIKVPNIVDEILGVKPLAPRASGAGGVIGGIVGAPMGAFMFAGNVGRAWGGTQGMREGAGRLLRNRGWGAAPPPTHEGNPANPESTTYHAAPPEPGWRGKVSRGLYKVAGPIVGGGRLPQPEHTVEKEDLRRAQEKRRAERGAFGTSKAGTPEGKADNTPPKGTI